MIVEEQQKTFRGIKSVAAEIERSLIRLSEQEETSNQTLLLIDKLSTNFETVNRQLVVVDKRYAALNEKIDKLATELNELING
jgi:septal ring factor EnvC (AmiA/AmiB activator)